MKCFMKCKSNGLVTHPLDQSERGLQMVANWDHTEQKKRLRHVLARRADELELRETAKVSRLSGGALHFHLSSDGCLSRDTICPEDATFQFANLTMMDREFRFRPRALFWHWTGNFSLVISG